MINLKKIPLLVLSLILLLTTTSFAEPIQENGNNTDIHDIEIRIGYDSPLYNVKLFFEDLRLKNAFTSVGKANVSKIFALRRMAEADLMIAAGDFDAANKLIEAGLVYMDMSTEYVVESVMKKDNGRSRLVLEFVSDAQNSLYSFVTELESEYPDAFDTQSMKESLKDNVIDTMVLWVYISYKETILDNPDIRDTAQAAYESSEGIEGISIVDAITTATLSELGDLGIDIGEGTVDAVTSATVSLLEDTGQNPDAVTSATQDISVVGGGSGVGVDTTSSATTTEQPADSLGVDTTSSATVTPTPAPGGGGGADATSSATVSMSSGSGSSSGGSSTYYEHDDDDHDEYEEREHEEREHEDEHDEHDDDDD